MSDKLRRLLLTITNDLSDEQKGNFLFLIGDDVPRSHKGQALTEVFDTLIVGHKVTWEDCSYLIDKMDDIGRIDLKQRIADRNMVTTISTSSTGISSNSPTKSSTSDFQPERASAPTILDELMADNEEDAIQLRGMNDGTNDCTKFSYEV
ncbi:unnamed protein product [Didymodactylos carnosus]|uniref:DED domain-containing protein n=1 Tax=Didymodactylos carnosus TaxID=1234261 RepID=A0A815FQL1_9BILA|nr:unnamed protein product [Didymodactylos carnosus]CAF1329010.1 unnamed protein product [Didymodactylos carnosus]CAF4001552.1 unnamed protein product [Didymodactylos carnosus]CAF4181005.1 unnamed protein product [Didymodactylos carnosus]